MEDAVAALKEHTTSPQRQDINSRKMHGLIDQSLRDLWDIIKWTTLWKSEKEKRERGADRLCEEIMA